MATVTKKLKKKLLRNNEYYGIQEVFDDLYRLSSKRQVFNDLLSLIVSEQNIMLAYRNIKRNKGSGTTGTDGQSISQIASMSEGDIIKYVQGILGNYKPSTVRRVEIPKPNDKKRPLGIPTIGDRLIQQCIKQVLEPICEAKFHPDSYGFRPNRSAHHAIARVEYLIHHAKLYYVVDVDIKGFFDNVMNCTLVKDIFEF